MFTIVHLVVQCKHKMIFVDKLRKYRRQSYCHMMSDESLGELHHFALKIGIKRHWFHIDHYDLREEDRYRALVAGAKETSSREMTKFVTRKRITQ
jgi:hypothetical protein